MKPLLPGINNPEGLKQMSNDQLEQVCAELRDMIISTVSHTGGHLGASLGVVELTSGCACVGGRTDSSVAEFARWKRLELAENTRPWVAE